MDRSSRGLWLALVFAAGATYQSSSFAAASCTTGGGVSYFGVEVYAAPQSLNGSGEYLYYIAGLRCESGTVVRWNEGTAWYKPDDMLESIRSAHQNMRRVFPNKCRTHAVVMHDNFVGSVDGVRATDYAVAKQTHFNKFAGPVFYERTEALKCTETQGVGNPDQPGMCPVQANDQPLQSPAGESSLVADPVNVSNGNSFQTEIDYQGLPGTQMSFARYYNSKTLSWSHNYEAKLQLSSTKIMLSDADGRDSLFTVSGGIATGSAKELGRLEQTASGWRYDNTRNERLHFNSSGQLIRIDRANGTYETLVHSPSSIVVTDSLGRSMTLSYNSAKRLTDLVADSLHVVYSYSPGGRLSQVTRTQAGQSKSRKYHYEDPNEGGLLTGITDERNVRYVTWAYDTKWRVIRNELSGAQNRYLFSYNANGSTTVTNPLGKQSTYSFQTIAGAKRISALIGAASANCPNSNSTFTYDSRGLIKTRTDNKGFVTTYDYNSRGLEVSRTEAAGTLQARTITTDWHPVLYKPQTITEPNRVINFEYDAQGNLRSQTITSL